MASECAMTNAHNRRWGALVIGNWSFIGHWSLDIGHSLGHWALRHWSFLMVDARAVCWSVTPREFFSQSMMDAVRRFFRKRRGRHWSLGLGHSLVIGHWPLVISALLLAGAFPLRAQKVTVIEKTLPN